VVDVTSLASVRPERQQQQQQQKRRQQQQQRPQDI
jgi:hypothetical protein